VKSTLSRSGREPLVECAVALKARGIPASTRRSAVCPFVWTGISVRRRSARGQLNVAVERTALSAALEAALEVQKVDPPKCPPSRPFESPVQGVAKSLAGAVVCPDGLAPAVLRQRPSRQERTPTQPAAQSLCG
jgi:hypothetical protein